MAEDYNFNFFQGTKSAGGAGAGGRKPAGDVDYRRLLKSLEKILKDSSKTTSDKLSKSFEEILTKFIRARVQPKGTSVSGGISKAELAAIAKEVALAAGTQQINQFIKAFKSKTTTPPSSDKNLQSIEKSIDRQAKTIVAAMNSLLSRKGIQLEDTKGLEQAITGAMRRAIPKETGTGIKEIGRLVVSLKSGINKIDKLVTAIAAMRKSGGGIDVREISKVIQAIGEISQEAKKVKESSKGAAKAIESVTNEVKGFKDNLKGITTALTKKVAGVKERAKEDPQKFAKTTAVAVGKALEQALRKSPTFKGSELERSIKRLDDDVKSIGGVFSKFKILQKEIKTAIQTGKISIDPKSITDLNQTLGKLPEKIGVDINTKGWKELVSGLEGFSKIVNEITGSLKKLKVDFDVDTKPVEKQVEQAVKKGFEKGLSTAKIPDIAVNVKSAMKEVDVSFNKTLNEMRKLWKETPAGFKQEKLQIAAEEMKSAYKRGDYPLLGKRAGGLQGAIDAPSLKAPITNLKEAIIEIVAELEGLGFKDFNTIIKNMKNELESAKVKDKLDKTGEAVDKLTSAIESKTKEIKQIPLFAREKKVLPAAMDKIKFLQESHKKFPAEVIRPGVGYELKGTEMGYGADVRKAVKEKADALSQSLAKLEKDLMEGLEAGPAFKQYGWRILDKKLKHVGQQWTLQIANVFGKKGLQKELQDLGKAVPGIADPSMILKTYKEEQKKRLVGTHKQSAVQADRIGKWLKKASVEDIEALRIDEVISDVNADILKEIKAKPKYKAPEVSEEMRQEIEKRLSASLEGIFKETFAAEEIERSIYKKGLVKKVAIPAAQISKTGTAIFKTRYGTERALPKFATYETGFEKMYKEMLEKGAMPGEEKHLFARRIIDVGMKPKGEQLREARKLSKSMLTQMARTGPEQLEFMMEQYKEAATMVGVKRKRAGVGTIAGYEKKIESGIDEFRKASADLPATFDEFVAHMETLGISAYDVVKSMESIKFENVYDIYRKVLKGEKGVKQPLAGLAKQPGFQSSIREFEQAVAQVEQLMPIIEPAKVRRGKHQEEVTTTFFQTSPIFKGAEEELEMNARKQAQKIQDINMNLRTMLQEYEELTAAGADVSAQTAKRLQRYTGPGGIPIGVKTISTLGPPEEQAARYKEFRPFEPKAKFLAPLGATAIKLYTEKLLDQAPFGEFSRLGKQISYVNSAMSTLHKEVGKVHGIAGLTTEEPTFRTTRERELIAGGRYGTAGYGFNVLAELRHSADTFEDQIIVSGNLAKALTQAVSTLVKPGPKGRISAGIGGPHVTEMEPGVLRDVAKEVGTISKKYMEILGVPKEYKKEADKALIESVEKELVAIRGEEIEIQKAKLAEVFMNYFGRKFTTRYGTKGVSITPVGEEGLGVAKVPKTMGQLASEILGTMEKEDVGGMQKALVESGNKFMLSMFSDATSDIAKGLGVQEEIEKQAQIFKDFTDIIRRVYGEELVKDVEGIAQLKTIYKKEIPKGERALFEEKPIDIRISARGAIKRGLQAEFIETIMGNVIGAGAGVTTVQPRLEKPVYEELLGTAGQRGLLSKYSKALGFEAAGPSKQEIEKELFEKFVSEGKTPEEAKIMAERAAAFEAMASYYTKVKNEYGKAVKSIVGPKFVQIIEEPHATEKWSLKEVKELKKGAALNLPAYAAYASVFGEKSPLMKQIRESTSLEFKKQWEYIKALEAMATAGPGKEMADAMLKGLKEVPLGELRPFEERTGTFSKEDMERSFKGTLLDLEKYATEFKVELPVGRGKKGEVLREPFYIPGALARQTYPEELVAGEFGMEAVARRLQQVINTALRTEKALAPPAPEDFEKVLRQNILDIVKEAKGAPLKRKQEVAKQLWSGLEDIEVEAPFRAEKPGYEAGTTEKQYITKFLKRWEEEYSKQEGKTYEDALQLTIGRMSDIIVGVGPKGRPDLQLAVPKIKKEIAAGKGEEFSKAIGISIKDEKEIDRSFAALRKAKVQYMSELAQAALGKGGALQTTLFERKAPAVLGKAIVAVTDRTEELKKFSDVLREMASDIGLKEYFEQFGQIANVIDEIGKEHAEIIGKYKKTGRPVLKQQELGIPPYLAKKIPVTFEKRYEMMSGKPILSTKPLKRTRVESSLYKMLEYKEELEKGLGEIDIKSDVEAIKKFIEEELVPHVETLRYPFTGVSSLQPYKAKILKEPELAKGKYTYAVPGVPEMRMATEAGKPGFVEQMKKVEGIRDELIKMREELHERAEAKGEAAPVEELAKLTKNINELSQAISDVLPKYTAIQQKLDFDGDEIEAHSGILAGARQDIKKHFDFLNKSTDTIETAWREVRGYEEAKPGATSTRFPFADLLTYFEQEWKPEKGYEFLKRPDITEKLEFLKPEEKLKVLATMTKKPEHQLLKEVVEEQIVDPQKREEIFRTINNSIEKGNDTSKGLLVAIKALDDDFSKLVEAGISESLYEQKYADAIVGQLYKLHTGPETEAIYRLQRLSEARMGFGAGMVAPQAGGEFRTGAAETFRKRWPTGLAMQARISPESELHTFMNELSRFAQQKGMDVKLAGEKPVGGEITSLLAKGVKGVNELLEKIGMAGDIANKDYEQLGEFAETSKKVIERRLGELPTEVIKKEIAGIRKARGMTDISMAGRKEAVEEAVRLIGFEGFLRELAKQIEEDAIEAITAHIESLGQPQRLEFMKRRPWQAPAEYAKQEVEYQKTQPEGINIPAITGKRMPLYAFRGFGATQRGVAEAYRGTAPEVKIPEVLKGTALERQYREAQEVALSIGRTLKEAAQMQPGGAYSEMVLTAMQNVYKEQEKREQYITKLRKEGYPVGEKRELRGIAERMLEPEMPGIPEGIRQLITPLEETGRSLQKLREEADKISLLAGIPPLSEAAKAELKLEMPEFGAYAREKFAGVPDETERNERINEFTELLIEKAQAVAQMDKAIAALLAAKGFETKLLPSQADIEKILRSEIKSTITPPRGRPTTSKIETERVASKAAEEAAKEMLFREKEVRPAAIPGGRGLGIPGPLTGRPSDEVVSVHIHSVAEGIGLTFTPAGTMKDVVEAAKAGPAKKYDVAELERLHEKASGVVETMKETYENIYRASALAGGGRFGYQGPMEGPRFQEEQVKAVEQIMRGKEKFPEKATASAYLGTALHRKIQVGEKEKVEAETGKKTTYDVERLVEYVNDTIGTVTGHVDMIQQRLDEKTKGYVDEKIIDIKTVDKSMVKRFKELGVKKFADIDTLKKKDILKPYDVKKLEDVASQINLYIAAVAQANKTAAQSLKGEAWFYDRDDIENMAKIEFEFDPSRLERDISAVSKARKGVLSEFGKEGFAKAQHLIDLRRAEQERKEGKPRLSEVEWEKFGAMSGEYWKETKGKSGPYWREKEVRAAKVTAEKFKEEETGRKTRFEEYTIPKAPAMGGALLDQLENLRTMHEMAKEHIQRIQGIDIGGLDFGSLLEPLQDMILEIQKSGPKGAEFQELMETYKHSLTGPEISKAWKYYRVAVGDFFLKQADEAAALEKVYSERGELGAARKQYGKLEQTTDRMKETIERGLGKPTDIYTYMRRYISPEQAQQTGLYRSPEQLIAKAGGALGEREDLKKIFEKSIIGDIGETKLKAPIEKVREVIKAIGGVDEEIIDVLVDADKFKRMGEEITEAWDFDQVAEGVTRLRGTLEKFLKFQLEEDDVLERKNLEDTLKLLRSLETAYSAFGRVQRPGKAGWGEMGLVKVPRFIEPQQQYAMQMRNLKKVREYFRKTEEGGGPKAGERYTYMFKVFGEAGDVIKNVAYDFRKYGDALDYAGQKTGIFKEGQRDIFKLMQEGGSTFKGAIMRAVRWGAASRLVYGGAQQIMDSISTLADVETGIASLRMVMSPLETDFEGLSRAAVGFAKQYGMSIPEVLRGMKIFAQQGLRQSEVIERTRTSTLATNVTTLDAKEATEALTAAMKVFRQEGDSSMKFMDAWSEVEARHAITAGDMANALKKSASAAKNAGFTFDELNGIIAGIGSVTRQTGKEVGTSLRFIFRRLASEKGPRELAKIGIPVLTEEGQLRRGYDVLSDLAGAWKELGSAQKMTIAQAVGGTRQYNSLLVLMDNWNEALSATKDSINSKGSAERRNLEIMKTYTKQLEQTKAAVVEVQMAFGKVAFPAFKGALKTIKTLLEAFSQIPKPIKIAMTGAVLFIAYLAKGADIVDRFIGGFRGLKSVVSSVAKSIGKEWQMSLYEMFGKGKIGKFVGAEFMRGLKTIGKQTMTADLGKGLTIPVGLDINKKDLERVTLELPQGKRLADFQTALGKTAFLIKQTGLAFNEFFVVDKAMKAVGDLTQYTAKGMEKVGGAMEKAGKSVALFNLATGEAGILGYKAIKDILKTGGIKGLAKAVPAMAGAIAAIAVEAAAQTAKYTGRATKFAGKHLGKVGETLVEGFVGSNATFVKSITPMFATIAALVPAFRALSEHYGDMTKTAQDYAKSNYGIIRQHQSQLSTIRDLTKEYEILDVKLEDTKKVMTPEIAEKRQRLGTYVDPLISLSEITEQASRLTNRLAEANAGLLSGYDSLGNAIIKTNISLKEYLKMTEATKLEELAEVRVKNIARYTKALTETEGPEKWKYELKKLFKHAPGIGEMLSRGIKISPAKTLNVLTDQLNKLIAAKNKYPLSTAFDADIKRLQEGLKEVRASYEETYKDLRREFSEISTKGLGRAQIKKIFGAEELQKAYELMLEVEPRFQLKAVKGKIKWEDILGVEQMKRAFPSLASVLDVSAELTAARLKSQQIFSKEAKIMSKNIIGSRDVVAVYETKAMSGDIVMFYKWYADRYDMAGKQAILKIKDADTAVLTYFSTAERKIIEREFTREELNRMSESIFPSTLIEEDLSDRIEQLNEFVAGAAAGLRGISAKDFKRAFSLGERFFSEIPTTTILQGTKGFVPPMGGAPARFGESPFQKDWKKTTEEFIFKPGREYKMALDELKRLRLEGLEGLTTTSQQLYDSLVQLQDVLKNNQVVLQYRAVFVDLTKTLEEGRRTLEQNLAVEKRRRDLERDATGYLKDIPKGLENINLGAQSFRDLTEQQRALMDPKYRKEAEKLVQIEIKRAATREDIYAIERARVATRNIREVATGFGAALGPEDLKDYVETISTVQDKGMQQMLLETRKVERHTASTVDRLDMILENMGDPDAVEKIMKPGVKDILRFGPTAVNTMERAAKVREVAEKRGDIETVAIADKAIDVLVKGIVDKYGLKEATKLVAQGKTPFARQRITPGEFQQRAFGGVDFETLTRKMEEFSPEFKKWSIREIEKLTVPGEFSKDVAGIRKLQAESNKQGLLSSKNQIKTTLLLTAWSEFRRKGTSRIVNKLDEQISGIDTQIEEAKKAGKEEQVGPLAAKKEVTVLAREEAKRKADLYKSTSIMASMVAGTETLAKIVGLTEGQISTLGATVVATYGSMKLLSMITGEDMPEKAKKFGKSLTDAGKKAMETGEFVVTGEAKRAGKEFMESYHKGVKEHGGLSSEDVKKLMAEEGYEEFKTKFGEAVKTRGKSLGNLGEMTLQALAEAKEGIKGTQVEEARRRLFEIVTYFLTYMFAAYGLEKMEHKTKMATNMKKAKKESELISKFMIKFPEDAAKAFEAIRSDQETMEKAKKIATTTKPLVMDTEKALKEIEEHYDTLDEAYTQSYDELTKKAAESIRKIAKQNLETALTKAMEDTIRNAATRMRSYSIERLYGEHAVLNRALRGFAGEARLPQYSEEMTTQQRLFVDASGKSMSAFKSALEVYSTALQEIEHRRENLRNLMERRTVAGEEGYTDIWEKLDEQVKKSAESLDVMLDRLSKFGMIARQVNDLAAAMNTLGDSLRSLTIEQTIEAMPGMERYRERMGGLYGGGGVDPLELMLPKERLRAIAAGRTDIDIFERRQEKERLELEYRRRWERPTGRAAHELKMEMEYLPEKYRTLRAGEKRRREVGKLETELAPYETYMKQLEKIRVAPGTTAEQSKAIKELQERVAEALERAADVVSAEEMKKEVKKGYKWWGGDITKEEYKETLGKIEAAGERQFRGMPLTLTKELKKEGVGVREQFLEALKEAPTLDMDKMGVAITDPLGEKLDEQTAVLRTIAEGMGIDDSVIDKMIEAMKETKTASDGSSIFKRAIQFMFEREKTPREKFLSERSKASGGRIFGEGGPREDKIPAMLSSGEYVIKAASAQKIGYGTLENMNTKGAIPRFQDGGGIFSKNVKNIDEFTKVLSEERMGLTEELWKEKGAANFIKNILKQTGLAGAELATRLFIKTPADLLGMVGGITKSVRDEGISGTLGKGYAMAKGLFSNEGMQSIVKAIKEDVKKGGLGITTGVLEALAGGATAYSMFKPGVAKKAMKFGKLPLKLRKKGLPTIKELTQVGSKEIAEITSVRELNELMTKRLGVPFELDEAVNLHSAKKLSEGLQREFENVPQMSKYIKKISTVTNLKKNVPAAWKPSGRSMEFNLKYMASKPEKFAGDLIKQAKMGHLAPVAKLDPWRALASHEFGHAVDEVLRASRVNAKRILDDINKGKIPKQSEQYMQTVKKISTGGKELSKAHQAKGVISKYAKTSPEEWFAEMYSSVSLLKDAPKELAKQLNIDTDVLRQLVSFSKVVDPSNIRRVKAPKTFKEGGIVDWLKELKQKYFGKPEEAPIGAGYAEQTKQHIVERESQLEKMRKELGWAEGGKATRDFEKEKIWEAEQLAILEERRQKALKTYAKITSGEYTPIPGDKPKTRQYKQFKWAYSSLNYANKMMDEDLGKGEWPAIPGKLGEMIGKPEYAQPYKFTGAKYGERAGGMESAEFRKKEFARQSEARKSGRGLVYQPIKETIYTPEKFVKAWKQIFPDKEISKKEIAKGTTDFKTYLGTEKEKFKNKFPEMSKGKETKAWYTKIWESLGKYRKASEDYLYEKAEGGAIPTMHGGGIKRTTGLAYLEKGEMVLPKQFAEGGVVDELKDVISIPTSAKSLNMKIEVDVSELKEIIEKGIEVNIDDTVKVGVDPGDTTVGVDPDAKVNVDISGMATEFATAVRDATADIIVKIDTTGGGVGAAENDALARVAESVETVNNSLITVKRELEEKIKMVGGVDELTINRMISEVEGKIQTELNNDVKTNIDDLRRELIQQRQISDYNVGELKYLIDVIKTKVG